MSGSGTFVYSVVRAVPRPRRDESVNVGVVVVAADGTFSDVQVSDLSRVKRLDRSADLRSIELFLEGIRARRPLDGNQSFLVPGSSALLTPDMLRQWSREFGGSVRISEPRAAIATDGATLLRDLYRDFVGPLPRTHDAELAQIKVPRLQLRGAMLSVVDRTLRLWNVAPTAVEIDPTIQGRRAEHVVDRAYYGPRRSLTAVLHAISFQTKDLADVYASRATIIVAAEDVHDARGHSSLPVFAVHSDAPFERLEAVKESDRLFRSRSVTPITVSNLRPLRQSVDALLDLSN